MKRLTLILIIAGTTSITYASQQSPAQDPAFVVAQNIITQEKQKKLDAALIACFNHHWRVWLTQKLKEQQLAQQYQALKARGFAPTPPVKLVTKEQLRRAYLEYTTQLMPPPLPRRQ
jgi:hypothetical protein